jgi:hypothetical protein
MADLTLDTARKILDAAFAKATELKLKPLVVADGTSCRHQIYDGTQREALHVARVLAMSLDCAETNSTSTAVKEPSHG